MWPFKKKKLRLVPVSTDKLSPDDPDLFMSAVVDQHFSTEEGITRVQLIVGGRYVGLDRVPSLYALKYLPVNSRIRFKLERK